MPNIHLCVNFSSVLSTFTLISVPTLKFPHHSFHSKKRPVASIPKGSWVGKKETIQGELERIVYCNEENHYTIARLMMGKEEATIVGNLYAVNVGESLQLTGEWTNHKTFGYQFKVESFLSIVPSTINGIEKYLGSGLIRGIGPVMAKRLVAKFKAKTLDVIESDIDSLASVEGIGEKRVEMIRDAWKEQREVRDVMVFLQTHGVSPAYAMKIFRRFGKKSISVVKENPYRLAMDVSGIGFKMADQIAGKLGIDLHSPHRVEAGVFYALRGQSDQGHVYYPYEMLVEESHVLLEVENDLICQAIEKLVKDRQIVLEDLQTGEGIVKAVYAMPVYIAECEIVSHMLRLMDFPEKETSQPKEQIETTVDGLEKEMKIKYSTAQREVVARMLGGEKVLVITGGPGTGKTTIIKSLVSVFGKRNKKVLLSAPTGRAAKRMSESTGREAKTIHRLLEFNVRKGGFVRDKENPLDADVAIIDETSMIDNYLMFHLIRAIRPGTTLILIGDVDQLPSVGAGNILKDIISSKVVATVFLNEIFRQEAGSLIVTNAHKINRGDFPLLPDKERGGASRNFYFFKSDTSEDSLNWILDLCRDRISRKFKDINREDIQVICPMNRGVIGTYNLNTELQAVLNPKGEELTRGEKIFRVGDRVMQVQNNYDKVVFNGDMGRIADINKEDQEIGIRFDDKRIVYTFNELDQLVLAYAITVHKSQGSEYPVVVLPMLMEHYMMLQRNLFYTVITRAKRLVVIVGSKKAMWIAVKNDKIRHRFTWLGERLREMALK